MLLILKRTTLGFCLMSLLFGGVSLVHAQSLNACKQVFTNYGSPTNDINGDGKVNILDCVSSVFPAPTPTTGAPTPTPDPQALQTEIENLNTQLLDLASDPNPDINQGASKVKAV